MFSIVHAVILKPLPVHEPPQLVQITLGESRGGRANWWLSIIGRLKSGESLQQAQAALRIVAPQIRALTIPEQVVGKARDDYLNEPFTVAPAYNGVSQLRAQYRSALLVLMGAVGPGPLAAGRGGAGSGSRRVLDRKVDVLTSASLHSAVRDRILAESLPL